MKSLLRKFAVCLAVIGYIIFLSCTEGSGADWKGYSKDEMGFCYYDVESITRPSKHVVRVWEKFVHNMEGRIKIVKRLGKKYETLSHTLTLSEFHCAEKKWRILQIVHYSPDGGTLFSGSYSEEKWDFIVPESIGESLYEILCK